MCFSDNFCKVIFSISKNSITYCVDIYERLIEKIILRREEGYQGHNQTFQKKYVAQERLLFFTLVIVINKNKMPSPHPNPRLEMTNSVNEI